MAEILGTVRANHPQRFNFAGIAGNIAARPASKTAK
jgi:hypothetical protein